MYTGCMDELEISGKRYLSSRRAAKQYRYHSDYIGQLIRGGKVEGTKVGRAWYVEVKSLADYLGQEEVVSPPVSVGAATPPGVVYIGRPPVEEKKIQPILKKETDAEVSKRVGLTYIPDNEPLFPEIRNNTNLEKIAEVLPVRKEEHHATGIEKVAKGGKTGTLVFLALGTAVVVLACIAALGSLFVSVTLTVEQGKPASVIYSTQ